MQHTMGVGNVRKFARLFMFPGLAHCSGGLGPDTFDVLTPVMTWVESGAAPTQIVASKVQNGTVVRSRPVYAYPTVARYDGSGSINDAANFVPYTPKREPGPGYDWLGEDLYSHGYQATCRAVGTQLVCDPARLNLKDARRT